MSSYHIPEPCHEDWERMTPTERGRHCASCDKVVVDLSACSPTEARAMLDEAAQRATGAELGLCARVRVDRRRRVLLGRARRYVLSNGLAALLAWGVAGCDGTVANTDPVPSPAPSVDVQPQPQHQDPPPEELQPVPGGIMMGEMMAPAPEECPVEIMGDVLVAPPAVEPVASPELVMGRIMVPSVQETGAAPAEEAVEFGQMIRGEIVAE
jgi:hypothetical protein